ncbi:hypothetical protein Tco_0957041 [Tanacetum coccineum]
MLGSLQKDDDDEISNLVDLYMGMLGGGWKWQDLQSLLWWIIIKVSIVAAFGWLLEELHMTWAHLEKKQTRLRLYTKPHDENAYSVWRRRRNSWRRRQDLQEIASGSRRCLDIAASNETLEASTARRSLGRHLEEIHVTWAQFWKKPDKMANGHED